MPDLRAVQRVVDDLLWVLRREGLPIATSQAVDAVRAVAAVGLDDRQRVKTALAAVVVARAADRSRFDAVFDAFFDAENAARPHRTLWDRLGARGFSAEEIATLREILDQLAGAEASGAAALTTLVERGTELDRAIAQSPALRDVDAESGPRIGFLAQQVLASAGVTEARRALGAVRVLLVGALGKRGASLVDALERELDGAAGEVRAVVQRRREMQAGERDVRRSVRRATTTPFGELTAAEVDEVRRAVRHFGERLKGAARTRTRRRARCGKIDAHRTLRRALVTGGVPLVLSRRSRDHDRPKLVVLCDISDSVRAAAVFLLEFVHAAQELFAGTRSFVFVSDVEETTALFAREPPTSAIARAWAGAPAARGDDSNYGRALRRFEDVCAPALDRRTTLIILGDGRTNYRDPAADVLERLRARARRVVWLCPEPRGQWSQGDSAMGLYGPRCTAAYPVTCAEELERVAREIVRRG